jgi:hypothetical protein
MNSIPISDTSKVADLQARIIVAGVIESILDRMDIESLMSHVAPVITSSLELIAEFGEDSGRRSYDVIEEAWRTFRDLFVYRLDNSMHLNAGDVALLGLEELQLYLGQFEDHELKRWGSWYLEKAIESMEELGVPNELIQEFHEGARRAFRKGEK